MMLGLGRTTLFVLMLRTLLAFKSTQQVRSFVHYAAVQNMDVTAFGAILIDDSKRTTYQIIDVREPNELVTASLKYEDVMNLPLSKISEWGETIKQGALLDKNKPTLCLCKAGVRGGKVAEFLVKEAEFKQVYNIVGGINKYAEIVDPSVGTY